MLVYVYLCMWDSNINFHELMEWTRIQYLVSVLVYACVCLCILLSVGGSFKKRWSKYERCLKRHGHKNNRTQKTQNND